CLSDWSSDVCSSDLVDGDDTITVLSGNNAHQNQNLVIRTGAGADSLAVNGDLVFPGSVDISTQTTSLVAKLAGATGVSLTADNRSEERRVGKERRQR